MHGAQEHFKIIAVRVINYLTFSFFKIDAQNNRFYAILLIDVSLNLLPMENILKY